MLDRTDAALQVGIPIVWIDSEPARNYDHAVIVGSITDRTRTTWSPVPRQSLGLRKASVQRRPVMGKLVRDRIPDIIRERGGDPAVTVLGEVDYRRALLEKLFEESTELSEASATEVAEEIADVLEVLRAIADVHGHEWRDIEKIAEVKRAERGAFLERIHLDKGSREGASSRPGRSPQPPRV
ncbi:hypothetical protein ACFQX6_26015 [Streptosporangium lutulentum]